MRERTLIVIKPDGVRRGLKKQIISRYEKAGLRAAARKELKAGAALLRRHYAAHVGKSFYPALERFMSSGTVVALVLEGTNAVAAARKVTGATDPGKAEKGTIRGDLGTDSQAKADKDSRAIENLVHASGTKEEAQQEIALWFPELVMPVSILFDTNIYGWALESETAAKLIAHIIDEQSKDTPRFRVFGYDVIRTELERNPHRDTRIRTLKLYESAKATEIRTSDRVKKLADEYFSQFKGEGIRITIEDCEIVASATVNNMDFIVTNNRRTLNSLRAKSLFKEINSANGFKTPAIVTAEEAVTMFSF